MGHWGGTPQGQNLTCLADGVAAILGSKNGSRYRGVSQLQSHQSRYFVPLRVEKQRDRTPGVYAAFFQEPLNAPFLNGLFSSGFFKR